MIEKKTSAEIMQVLEMAQNDVEKVKEEVSIMNDNITKELNVLRNIQEYAIHQSASMIEAVSDNSGAKSNNKTMFVDADIITGSYDIHGNTIHPKLIKTPIDIFNFGTSKGKLFKNNANVSINGVVKSKYKSMLMDDSILDKDIAFDEFESPDITLEVEINPDIVLGSTAFNMLDVLPYLPGSFTINEIRVYTMDNLKRKVTSPAFILGAKIEDMGTSRIFLGDSMLMYKCQIDISLKFRNAAGMYPFGLKHLYFQKASYDTDSHIIAKISQNKFINTISEDMYFHNQNGKITTTCKKMGIKLYQAYDGEKLDIEIPTSRNAIQNPIAKNIKEFYAYIPVTCSMISMQFDSIETR